MCLSAWRRDRLGRNLRHLILLLDELSAVGVAFVTLNEGVDTATPAGRLQLRLLSAISQFERDRIRERVLAGLARARSQGKAIDRGKGCSTRLTQAPTPTVTAVRLSGMALCLAWAVDPQVHQVASRFSVA